MKYHGWPMDAEAAYLDLLGKLSAANARIAELEDAIINANDGLLDGEGVPLTYYMRNGKYKDLIASVTAPSQPTTLPE